MDAAFNGELLCRSMPLRLFCAKPSRVWFRKAVAHGTAANYVNGNKVALLGSHGVLRPYDCLLDRPSSVSFCSVSF